MKKYNPFEIPEMNPEKPIEILFLTDALAKEITNNNPVFKKLHKLSEFAEIDIFFSPTTDIELIRIITDEFQCAFAEYEIEGNIVSLIRKNSTSIISTGIQEFRSIPDEKTLFERVNGSRINAIEMKIIQDSNSRFRNLNLFDLIVMHQQDLDKLPILSQSEKFNLLHIDEFLERVRLFMLNYRLFFVEKWFSIDELQYYAYRRLKLFPNAKRLWSIIGYTSENTEWVQSLYTRLELYLRAMDKLKITTLRKTSNSTGIQFKYDLAFTTLLITGMFDNLAWLICKIYDIKLNRMKIDLRRKDFLKAVEVQNVELYDYLISDLTQAKIDLLYPIRDAVVHRDYFTYIHYTDKQKKIDSIYLQVPSEFNDKVKKLVDLGMDIAHCFDGYKVDSTTIHDIYTGETSIFGESEKSYIIPHAFIYTIDDIFKDLINDVLNILIAKACDSKISVDDDLSNFFTFFDKGVEPVYF